MMGFQKNGLRYYVQDWITGRKYVLVMTLLMMLLLKCSEYFFQFKFTFLSYWLTTLCRVDVRKLLLFNALKAHCFRASSDKYQIN